MKKHMFAGTMTPIGFVSYFDHILPLEKTRRRYFLKGSSGSGKSTFMKKIAAELELMGQSVERFHCANDVDSLDAVSTGEVCFIDATAPHLCEPEIPAAVDEIIDFAHFLDEEKLKPRVGEIKALIAEKKTANKKAAELLAAVGDAFGMQDVITSVGAERKMFLSAFTPDGLISFAEHYFMECRKVETGVDFGRTSGFLAELRDEANACGEEVMGFYSPLAPNLLEYLHFPKVNIVFINKGRGFDGIMLDNVIAVAVKAMHKARSYHYEIEKIYAEAMDFEGVDKKTQEVLVLARNNFER